MRTHVMELKTGDQLKNDTFNQAGLHVLPKGTRIRNEEIALLIRQSIDYVDIEPRAEIESITESDRESFSKRLKENFDATLQVFQSIFLEALTTGKFNQSMVDSKLQPFLEVVDEQKDIVSLLLTLGRDDVNLQNHSLQVSLLSYYIATWLNYSKEESYKISKAGYLHDIGKSRIRQSVRNSTYPLSEEEAEEMKKHVNLGYDVIMNATGDEVLALVALQHHEYEDGSGYPNRISRGEIHPYAEIVAVANTYIGLTSSNPRHPKQGLLTVLRQVYELGFSKLNAKAVQTLTWNLLPCFIGRRCELSNGKMATVVLLNPTDFFNPLVKVGDDFVDLSKERDITIQEVFL